MRNSIFTYKHAKKLLRTKGVQAFVEVCHGSSHVKVDKSDLLGRIKYMEQVNSGPVDYDGNKGYWLYDEDNKELTILSEYF